MRAEGRSPEDWLGFFAQNGSYNVNSQPLLSFQRLWRVYVELPETDAARRHPQLSWARWLNRHARNPPPRLPALEARWEDMVNEAVRVLGLPPEEWHNATVSAATW